MENKILILCGSSASGKDTIAKELQKQFGFNPIVSDTTRPMRGKEQEGVDYYFLDTKEFKNNLFNNLYVETRNYTTLLNGKQNIWWYGTSKREIGSKNKKVCVVDVQGAVELQKYIGKESTLIIALQVEEEERKERAIKRGSFDKQEWQRRLLSDKGIFTESNLEELGAISVSNQGTIEETVAEIKKIIEERGYSID